jgi:chemotaxis protein CheX
VRRSIPDAAFIGRVSAKIRSPLDLVRCEAHHGEDDCRAGGRTLLVLRSQWTAARPAVELSRGRQRGPFQCAGCQPLPIQAGVSLRVQDANVGTWVAVAARLQNIADTPLLAFCAGSLSKMARRKKSEDARIALPQRLQGPEIAEALQAALAVRGRALVIDASGLTHLGVLGIQLLLSMAKTWRQDEVTFEITGLTAEARAILGIVGVAGSALGIEGEAT